MSPFVPWVAALQAAPVRDTMLVRPLPPVRTAFEQFVFVTSGLVSVLSLIVLALVLAMLVAGTLAARRAARATARRVDALLADLRPLIAQATAVSEGVRHTVDSLQTDAHVVHGTVQDASTRVKATVAHLADRVDDFNDLLGKVHARADSVADAASAAIGGLSWGVKALSGQPKRKKRRGRGSR